MTRKSSAVWALLLAQGLLGVVAGCSDDETAGGAAGDAGAAGASAGEGGQAGPGAGGSTGNAANASGAAGSPDEPGLGGAGGLGVGGTIGQGGASAEGGTESAGGAPDGGGTGASGAGGEDTQGGTPSIGGGGEAGMPGVAGGGEGGSGGACSSVDAVADGGFESSVLGDAWVKASTNFGSPVCTVADCGTGGGSGPFAGTVWVFFGGVSDAVEQGSMSQSVVIPNGPATLRFELSIPSCEGTALADDTFEVSIDGVIVFETNNGSPRCGLTTYQLQEIDISAYADGASHVLEFSASTDDFTTSTNFMLDDVELMACGPD